MPSLRLPSRTGTARGPRQRRLTAVLVASLVGFGAISVRLVDLQVVQGGALAAAARAQRTQVMALPASRGSILDRSGQTLATSVPARTIYADNLQVVNPVSEADQLAPLLGMPARTLVPLLRLKRSFVYLAHKQSVQIGDEVTKLNLPGVGVLDTTRRTYPNGPLAGQTIGFVGASNQGLDGLELQYNQILSGRPGSVTRQVAPGGQRIPQTSQTVIPAQPGSDLVTTLDTPIQYVAQQALVAEVAKSHAHSGSVIVIVPKTGQILAMATAPSFNPSQLATSTPSQWRNRAVTDVYEPGSISKLVTSSAAVQEGIVTPTTPITVPPVLNLCPHHSFHDAEVHGTEHLTFQQVIGESSNIGTIEVATKIGSARLAAEQRAFGFGLPTGLSFPGASRGIVTPASTWGCTGLATNAIGMGAAVTLMQMASAYATIANNGVWVQPSLVAGTVSPQGVFHSAPRPQERRVVSATTAATVRHILENPVQPWGTAPAAALPNYTVAGKTGTANVIAPTGGYLRGAYTASFIGMAPAQHPAVVVAVVLDRPSPIYGGLVAAPIFHAVASFALARLGITPTGGQQTLHLAAPPGPGAAGAGGSLAPSTGVVPAAATGSVGPARFVAARLSQSHRLTGGGR